MDDDLLGFRGIGNNLERIADLRQRLQAQHLNRHGWFRLANLRSPVVEHRANFAEYGAANEEVADSQRAVAHQYSRDWAASPVQLRLENRAHRRPFRIRFEI